MDVVPNVKQRNILRLLSPNSNVRVNGRGLPCARRQGFNAIPIAVGDMEELIGYGWVRKTADGSYKRTAAGDEALAAVEAARNPVS